MSATKTLPAPTYLREALHAERDRLEEGIEAYERLTEIDERLGRLYAGNGDADEIAELSEDRVDLAGYLAREFDRLLAVDLWEMLEAARPRPRAA